MGSKHQAPYTKTPNVFQTSHLFSTMRRFFSPVYGDPDARLRAIEAELNRIYEMMGEFEDQDQARREIVQLETGRINLDGDVTGPTTETLVIAIQHVPIDAPVAGDDTFFAVYDHGNGVITWENIDHDLLSGRHVDTVAADPVAGDIIYANATPAWTKLAKGTDGEVLTLVSGLPSWEAAAGGGDEYYTIIGGWVRNDMQNAGTSFGQMPFAAPSTGVHTGIFIPTGRTLVVEQISLRSETAVLTGDAYTAEVYKNGSGSGLQASLGNGASSGSGSGTSVTFNSSDQLDVYDKKTNTPPAQGVSVFLWGYVT